MKKSWYILQVGWGLVYGDQCRLLHCNYEVYDVLLLAKIHMMDSIFFPSAFFLSFACFISIVMKSRC